MSQAGPAPPASATDEQPQGRYRRHRGELSQNGRLSSDPAPVGPRQVSHRSPQDAQKRRSQGTPRDDRADSPSVTKSVLQPLEKKITQYAQLMADAEDSMTQLDDEMRVLQERRRQAEDGFLEAKAKHDLYERQHADVGRALRGELQRPQRVETMAVERPPSMIQRVDSPRERERPNSGGSGGTLRMRDRIRNSIFKNM